MRAAVRERWGSPAQVVRIAEVAKPHLEDDTVLVRVKAVSVNRADYYSARSAGLLLRPLEGGFLKPKRRGLGTDFAGVVEAVGKDVAGVQPGDSVFGGKTPSFGEYVAARTFARMPPDVPFEQAAAVPLAGLTALQALRDHGGLETGQTVLVNGASGAVGTFAVSVAKALGAARVAAVCRTRNVEQARALGADDVIDYTVDDFTTRAEQYDLIVDIAGMTPWRRLRRALRPDGTLVIVGTNKSGNPLIGPLGHIAGLWLATRLDRRHARFFVAKFNRPDLELLAGWLESGQLAPAIERVYPFEEIGDALETMGTGHARGKLVVTL